MQTFLVGLLVLAVGFVAFRSAPSLNRRLHLLRVQQQCMEWQPDAQTIVWDEDNSSVGVFRDSDALYFPPPGISSNNLERKCPPWLQLQEYLSDLKNVHAPAFCHRRVSPAGNRRLVVVNRPRRGGEALWCEVIRPGSLFQAPQKMRWKACPDYAAIAVLERVSPSPLRLYAGQADQNDASHFTIDYEIQGMGRGTIDGWLQDEDWIKLQVRDGPARPSQAFQLERQAELKAMAR